MIIGIPSETRPNEHRVGLNPFAVSRLCGLGHDVVVQSEAGLAAHFDDRAFEVAGARIVYSAEEVFRRSDLVCKVGGVTPEERGLLRRGSILCGFQHLAVTPREHVEALMELDSTVIGYELVRDERGEMPLLIPFSEMAGQMAVNLATFYLQKEAGGRGVLMGNVPGVPPPTVVVLGAGTVGRIAARQALAHGVHVIVLDNEIRKLRELNHELRGAAVTAVASERRLAQFTPIADAIIGAVLVPGERAPFVVSEDMVRDMKSGSVIVDVSIDQGGCVETSRPTTPDNPTFVHHDVVHYCVPNMTANIPRTASRALVTAALPRLTELAQHGLDGALRRDPALRRGVCLYRGRMTHRHVARSLDLPVHELEPLMEQE